MSARTLVFLGVGAIGFTVQIAVLTLLTAWLHTPVPVATAIAVEAAILVNFWWHERWTWRERAVHGARTRRLLRFHLANGVTSLVGNVAITTACVRLLAINPAVANAMAVAVLAAINYVAADRWVFAARAGLGTFALLHLLAPPVAAAELRSDTLAAWNRYIDSVEQALPAHENDAPLSEPAGRAIPVPGGTIHEWRGSIVASHTTVAALVDALTNPGTPPPQDDVLESRVLDRHGDVIRVYLKLSRSAIVTVTYDTDHDVRFIRRSQTLAISRSVATRIVEVGGEDHGFLWKLNSYWRYRQVGDSVVVDVLSVSLSRAVPALVKPVAGPIVNRVARDSMIRTLDAVKRFAEAHPPARASAAAERLDGDARGVQTRPQGAGNTVGARRIAVNADGVDPHHDAGTVDGFDAAVGHHAYGAGDDRG